MTLTGLRRVAPTLGATGVWAVLVALRVAPVIYFVAHRNDAAFVGNAMGNWFATTVGILVGVPVGLEIGRRQHLAQERALAAARHADELRQLRHLIYQLGIELLENEGQLDELAKTLALSRSRTDLWAWAVQIVNSFSFDSYPASKILGYCRFGRQT